MTFNQHYYYQHHNQHHQNHGTIGHYSSVDKCDTDNSNNVNGGLLGNMSGGLLPSIQHNNNSSNIDKENVVQNSHQQHVLFDGQTSEFEDDEGESDDDDEYGSHDEKPIQDSLKCKKLRKSNGKEKVFLSPSWSLSAAYLAELMFLDQ